MQFSGRISGSQFGYAIAIRLGVAVGAIALMLAVLFVLNAQRNLGLSYIFFFVGLPVLVVGSAVSIAGPTVRRLRDAGISVFWAGALVLQIMAVFAPPLPNWIFVATSLSAIVFLISMRSKTNATYSSNHFSGIVSNLAMACAAFFTLVASLHLSIFLGLVMRVPTEFLLPISKAVWPLKALLQMPLLVVMLVTFTTIAWKHRVNST